MPTTADLSLWLAAWGAALSTTLAVLKVLQHLTDRGRLKVRGSWQRGYEPANVPGGPSHVPTGPEQPALYVTNVGRRRVRLVHIGMHFGRGWRLWKRPVGLELGGPDIERTLEEGDVLQVRSPIVADWVLNQRVVGMYAADSTGRIWRLPQQDLRRLRHPQSFDSIPFPRRPPHRSTD